MSGRGLAPRPPCHQATMATSDTRPTGKNPAKGRTTEVEQQLDRLIESFERVDWRRVDGVSTPEAAALGERLRNAEASR